VDWGITPNGSLSGFAVEMREDYRWQKRDALGQWQEAPQFTGSTFHAVTFADAGIYRAVGKLKNLCDFEVWSPTLTLVVLGPPRWANPVFDPAGAGFRADLTGPATGVYGIQVSTDLVNWVPWLTQINLPAGFRVVDTNVAPSPQKFYRASVGP
jgi:hypothetical protein